MSDVMARLISGFVILAGLGVLACAYLLPTLLAVRRSHRQKAAIAAINILIGWTFLGWAAAFAWALTNRPLPAGASASP